MSVLVLVGTGSLRSGISSVVHLSGEEVPTSVSSGHLQPWPATAALIIAEVVGVGVLALGGQMAVLGIRLGTAVLVMCYPLNVFTSLLLGRIHKSLPGVVTFGDAFHALVGYWAGLYGYIVLYVYIFLSMANYMIVLGESIDSIAYDSRLCRPVSCAVGAIILIPTNQFRTLSGLTVLSVLSFATLVATLVICLATLLAGTPTCAEAQSDPSFLEYSSAISGLIFAFAGQNIMLEIQAEMRSPHHFPRAVCLAFSILFLVYALVALLSYRACGRSTPGDLLSVLPRDWRKALAGVLMTAHLMVTYTIYQQVLNRALCLLFLPGALDFGRPARVKWLSMTSLTMAACYTVANSIPLFQDIVNLTGALLSTQCGFIIPPVLFLALRSKRRDSLSLLMPTEETRSWKSWQSELTAVVSVLVAVLGGYFAVTGTVATMRDILQKLADPGNEPFACHAAS